jgi:predicted CXXCH cytochrome family protein
VSKFGETDNYIEKASSTLMPIACGVCHDPHGSPFDADLRADIREASRDNFCVKCHARTGTPPGFRGPHAAQGLLVIGENVGWIPPNFQYDTTVGTITGTHGTEANPRLCATCHVASFEVTDPQTGDFVFQSVGHLFEAIPCLDAQGLPTSGPCTLPERDFRACTGSGCHGTVDAARSAYQTVRNRLNFLLDQIWNDVNGNSVIDPDPTDTGVLPQVVAKFPATPSVLDPRDQNITVAEGTLWNAQLAYTTDRPWFASGRVYGISFSAHKSSGDGVHNPFLLEALLTSSIQAVQQEYGLNRVPEVDLSVQATPPAGLRSR